MELPPYDALKIAKKAFNINTYSTNFDNSDGIDVRGSVTKTRDDSIENAGGFKYIFYIEDSLSQKRKNFTIAHLLGHVALGHLSYTDYAEIIENQERRDNPDYKKSEIQANLFAIDLLILRRDYSMAINAGINTIRDLSMLFNVTETTIVNYSEIIRKIKGRKCCLG